MPHILGRPVSKNSGVMHHPIGDCSKSGALSKALPKVPVPPVINRVRPANIIFCAKHPSRTGAFRKRKKSAYAPTSVRSLNSRIFIFICQKYIILQRANINPRLPSRNPNFKTKLYKKYKGPNIQVSSITYFNCCRRVNFVRLPP